MEVSYLILEFEKKTRGKVLSDEDKMSILKKIISPKPYINFKEKCDIAKQVLNETVQYKDGNPIWNSSIQYFCLMNKIIGNYYDIHIEESTYDKLCSKGILRYLLLLLGNEYEYMIEIMDMYKQDLEKGRLLL